ncbi:MAG: four helix bundle protein, partial [Bacteroidales bacterium]|nr:four helix bundle protein [Bacteroidales bacterium]
GTFRDLNAYQLAFEQAMDIYETSKSFPREELYSLTDQIRRASRSVCANIGEGYRKRQYQAHFISKISDSDMENTETQIWLDFALACGFISEENHKVLVNRSQSIGRILNHMIHNPEKFQRKSNPQNQK